MAPLVASFACVVVRSLSPFIYLCQALKLTTTIHRRHLKMRCPLGSSSGVRRLLGDSCWRTGEAWRRLSCWQFVLRWPRGNEHRMSTNPIICAKRNTSGTKVTVGVADETSVAIHVRVDWAYCDVGFSGRRLASDL